MLVRRNFSAGAVIFAIGLFVLACSGTALGQSADQKSQISTARTISAYVYWPGADFDSIAEARADAIEYLRKWKRYAVVSDPGTADLVVIFTPKLVPWQPSGWQRFFFAMSQGMVTASNSLQQQQSYCSGTATAIGQNSASIEATCMTAVPQQIPMPQMPTGGTALSGTVALFSASDLRVNAFVPPLLIEEAGNSGNDPLGGSLKKLLKKAAADAPKISVQTPPEDENAYKLVVFGRFVGRIRTLATKYNPSETQIEGLVSTLAKRIGGDRMVLGRVSNGDWSDIDRWYADIESEVFKNP